MDATSALDTEQFGISLSNPDENNLQNTIEKPKLNPSGHSPRQQGTEIPIGYKRTLDKPLPPVQCVHIHKPGHQFEGQRCGKYALRGSTTGKCLSHSGMGNLPNVSMANEAMLENARNNLMLEIVNLIDKGMDLIDHSESDAVKATMIRDYLDRLGFKAGTEINLNIKNEIDPGLTLSEKLKAISSRNTAPSPDPDSEIQDGEVIEDSDEPTLF